MYNAFLAIRLLGDAGNTQILEDVKASLLQNSPKQLIQLMSVHDKDEQLNKIYYALKLFLSQIWQNNRQKNKKTSRIFTPYRFKA